MSTTCGANLRSSISRHYFDSLLQGLSMLPRTSTHSLRTLAQISICLLKCMSKSVLLQELQDFEHMPHASTGIPADLLGGPVPSKPFNCQPSQSHFRCMKSLQVKNHSSASNAAIAVNGARKNVKSPWGSLQGWTNRMKQETWIFHLS